MEYEILGVSSPSTKEEVVSASSGHYNGEVKTTAYTGYTIQTYKVKYDKETKEQISRDEEEYSVYDKRDQVVYKVNTPAATTPPETEPTNPPSTEPTTPDTEPTDPSTESTDPPTDPTDPPESDGGIGEGGGDSSIPGEE